MVYPPDFVNGLLAGAGSAMVIGAAADRRLDSPWRIVVTDACVGMVGAAVSVQVSYSTWVSTRATRRSIMNPGWADPFFAVLAGHPVVVAGVTAALAALFWRGLRHAIRHRHALRPEGAP